MTFVLLFADFLSFQYVSVLELLGSVYMMSRNLPYRKYRPVVQVHRNASIWSASNFDFKRPHSDDCIVTFCSCCLL